MFVVKLYDIDVRAKQYIVSKIINVHNRMLKENRLSKEKVILKLNQK